MRSIVWTWLAIFGLLSVAQSGQFDEIINKYASKGALTSKISVTQISWGETTEYDGYIAVEGGKFFAGTNEECYIAKSGTLWLRSGSEKPTPVSVDIPTGNIREILGKFFGRIEKSYEIKKKVRKNTIKYACRGLEDSLSTLDMIFDRKTLLPRRIIYYDPASGTITIDFISPSFRLPPDSLFKLER